MRNADKLASGMVWLALFLSAAGCVWAFDDVRYDIQARLDAEKHRITAQETLTFTNNTDQALEEVYLRVYPNHRISAKEKRGLYRYASYFRTQLFPDGFDPGAFRIESLTGEEGGAFLAYTFEGDDQTVLRVALNKPLQAGASLSLRINFSLTVPHRVGRYGWHAGTFALNRWYPLLSFFDGRQWRNHPDYLLHMPYVSDAARYALTLDVPADYVVASGCEEVSEEATAGGRKIVRAASRVPLRELALAASRDYAVYETSQNGILIASYYLKANEAAGRKAAAFAAGMLAYYGEQFGPYPYKRFSVASVYLGYGGSQNSGLIFIDTRAYEMPSFLDRYFDFLVAHETGHQWWYNVVGNDEFSELWLDEGLNSFGTLAYLDHKYGAGAKIVPMPSWFRAWVPDPSFDDIRTYRYWLFVNRGLDRPILSDMVSFYEPSMIFTVAYGKGSGVFEMLKGLIGDEAFAKVLRQYFERYRFKTATSGDFTSLVNEVTGADYGWFFKEWLTTVQRCDYAVVRRNGRLVLEKRGQSAMPVDVRLTYADGSQETLRLDGKDEEKIILPAAGKTIRAAEADPDQKLLETDRVNNHYPRQTLVRAVPLYHNLYDMSVFAPRDKYLWVTGPSLSRYGIGLRSSFQRPGETLLYAATHYDTGAKTLNSSTGFEQGNLWRGHRSWGVEYFNRQAYSDDEDFLNTAKIYLRQELSLAYSLLDPADHVTAYLVRNQSRGKTGFLGSREEARNLRYRQREESIVGVTYYKADAGPFPDPGTGYKVEATQEAAGRYLGGDDDFTRTLVEVDRYVEFRGGHKLAFRLKGGYGAPKDQYLFYLGNDTDLRGYDYKSVQGSSVLLGSVEYRFPVTRALDIHLPWNVAVCDGIQGVVFFDTGSAWYEPFNEPGFKKDVGFGLRFYFNVAGGVERVALRIDIAQPLSGADKDTHLWVGVNQAF